MTAQDHLSHPQFGSLQVAHEPDHENLGHDRAVAWFDHDDNDHRVAGYISHAPAADGNSTSVRVVHVEEDRRRMGVASHLMKHLEQRYPHIDHGSRTPDGQAWWQGRKP